MFTTPPFSLRTSVFFFTLLFWKGPFLDSLLPRSRKLPITRKSKFSIFLDGPFHSPGFSILPFRLLTTPHIFLIPLVEPFFKRFLPLRIVSPPISEYVALFFISLPLWTLISLLIERDTSWAPEFPVMLLLPLLSGFLFPVTGGFALSPSSTSPRPGGLRNSPFLSFLPPSNLERRVSCYLLLPGLLVVIRFLFLVLLSNRALFLCFCMVSSDEIFFALSFPSSPEDFPYVDFV